jgi:serine/threonine-protein kinase HipA
MKFDPKKLNALSVRLHGKHIGVITRLAGDRQLFAFEQDYIDDPQRPTLSLSFKGSTGGLVTNFRPVGRRVPVFFSNLLPEGHLRDYLAQRAGVNPDREFFLLAILGADLPGALVIEPLEGDNPSSAPQDARDDDAREDGPSGEQPLRFSLAGVQLKFSAIMEASGGLTIPAGGLGGSWIVKLPSARFKAVPENEFAMLELARRTGIFVPENKLIDVDSIKGLPEQAHTVEGKALAVKRFDRLPDAVPVHMEDFAQVFGEFPNNKYKFHSYANIAAVLWAEIGEDAVHEFLRRLVFSVVIGNADMHLKNWSLLYPDRRTPVLSPGYDFVATLPYIPGDTLGLSFGDSRSLSEVTPDQIRRFADTARIPASPLWKIAVETAERTAESWKTLEHADILPKNLKEAIGNQILSVAKTVARAAAG